MRAPLAIGCNARVVGQSCKKRIHLQPLTERAAPPAAPAKRGAIAYIIRREGCWKDRGSKKVVPAAVAVDRAGILFRPHVRAGSPVLAPICRQA
jgi:hypothetical protein